MANGTSSVSAPGRPSKSLYGINPQCWITSELLSPGLWGIESDSGDAYFRQVFQEEREILIGMLASLKTSEVIQDRCTLTTTGDNND
jgi:hypothetical protein